jgi:hypothetical protein
MMEPMEEQNPRMQILAMIESGVITADEGARLIQAIEDETDQAEFQEEVVQTQPDYTVSGSIPATEESPVAEAGEVIDDRSGPQLGEFDEQIAKWRRWWTIPLWVGVGITILGGLFMFWAYQASGYGFWFGCAWVPFLMGVAIMAFAVSSRTSRWLHLRVHQKPGERPQTIAFSFPLPLRFAAWFVRSFGRYIPQLNRNGLDEMILALGRNTGPDAPFYIEVDEGEDGEQVQIYIG